MATIRLDTVFLITLLVVIGALVACGTQANPADHPSGPPKGPPPEMLRQAEQFERRMMDHRRQMERQRMDLNRMRDEMRGRAERERERLQQARKDLQEREQRLKVKSSKLATDDRGRPEDCQVSGPGGKHYRVGGPSDTAGSLGCGIGTAGSHSDSGDV